MPKIKLKKQFKEKIIGGLASGKDISSFDAESIKKGINIELEHTDDIDIAAEIAMDHLSEDPKYYDKLAKMEKGVYEMKIKIKKQILNEELSTAAPDFTGTPDNEGEMAKSQMIKVNEYSGELLNMMTDDMQLPSWVQSKLTKIADYIGAVKHFIEGEMKMQEDFSSHSYVIEARCDKDELYELELYSEECGCGHMERSLEEAEYQGRKVSLNKPMRGDVKKFKVYVKDPKTGNVKKVNFGDPNMRIKKSNPERRKSFRARHNCDNPGPKTKARYWSCRKWEE